VLWMLIRRAGELMCLVLRVLSSLMQGKLGMVLRKVTLLMLVCLLRMSKLMLLRLLIEVMLRMLSQLGVVVWVNWLLVGDWLRIDGRWWWLLTIHTARLLRSTSTWSRAPCNGIHSRVDLSHRLSQGAVVVAIHVAIAIAIAIRASAISLVLSAPQTLEMLTVYVLVKGTPVMVARDQACSQERSV
jgi:hypothetical protein